jgi:hypothetical protein
VTNKKIINEFKAQGIEEAIKKADGETLRKKDEKEI